MVLRQLRKQRKQSMKFLVLQKFISNYKIGAIQFRKRSKRWRKQSIIEYKTPIRVAFSVFYGTNETDALEDILKNSGIEYTKVPRDDLKNMEYSKLFTNLIGIPSYSLGFNIEDGLRNKDAFKEEMLALKEYVAVVKKSGGHFLNLPHYPIATFASLVEHIPLSVLLFFRPTVTKLVLSLRHTKEKGNIDEIDYYTGAIIDLGKKYRVEMPINERVLRRIKMGETLKFILLAGFAYLLGSVPFGYIIGKINKVDVLQIGSKSASSTNVSRALGWRWASISALLDFQRSFTCLTSLE